MREMECSGSPGRQGACGGGADLQETRGAGKATTCTRAGAEKNSRVGREGTGARREKPMRGASVVFPVGAAAGVHRSAAARTHGGGDVEESRPTVLERVAGVAALVGGRGGGQRLQARGTAAAVGACSGGGGQVRREARG